ncbi:gluconate 2-dehydrogenase subunit 3 family protein [soil metagenome]
MTPLQLPESSGGGRFPGFDVVEQSPHWDEATRRVVLARLDPPDPLRFFDTHEEATARALFDQLLDQHDEPRVPVINMVDQRLTRAETDGWHYEGMPPDGETWKLSLANLDRDAQSRFSRDFYELARDEQGGLLQAVLDLGSTEWHGIAATRIWSLWTRYACTAFYSHPDAWDEIGFAGPAYPRGYKNMGVNRLEPFEVKDAHPRQDPLRGEAE